MEAKPQAHQCTSTRWLVNSGPICSVLCWPYSSAGLNGCHEHSTGNGNGIRQRGNGRLSSPRWICDTVCLCVCGLMHETDMKPAAHISSPPDVEESAVSRRRNGLALWWTPLNSSPKWTHRQAKTRELLNRSPALYLILMALNRKLKDRILKLSLK